jgi:negative regulator of flagellin synthesis FlgM
MRVDLSNTQASQIASESSSQQVSQQGTTPVAVGGDEDRTTLTSDSGSVSSLVSSAMSNPEIREDKVASLQQAIANGQYDLDPEKIAASMLDEHA